MTFLGANKKAQNIKAIQNKGKSPVQCTGLLSFF